VLLMWGIFFDKEFPRNLSLASFSGC